MREKINKVLLSIFSVFILIAIAGGGIVFLMFVAAILVGGNTAETLAVNANKLYMPCFIKAASIGVMAGLLSFYITKSHALSLNDEDIEEASL